MKPPLKVRLLLNGLHHSQEHRPKSPLLLKITCDCQQAVNKSAEHPDSIKPDSQASSDTGRSTEMVCPTESFQTNIHRYHSFHTIFEKGKVHPHTVTPNTAPATSACAVQQPHGHHSFQFYCANKQLRTAGLVDDFRSPKPTRTNLTAW